MTSALKAGFSGGIGGGAVGIGASLSLHPALTALIAVIVAFVTWGILHFILKE